MDPSTSETHLLPTNGLGIVLATDQTFVGTTTSWPPPPPPPTAATTTTELKEPLPAVKIGRSSHTSPVTSYATCQILQQQSWVSTCTIPPLPFTGVRPINASKSVGYYHKGGKGKGRHQPQSTTPSKKSSTTTHTSDGTWNWCCVHSQEKPGTSQWQFFTVATTTSATSSKATRMIREVTIHDHMRIERSGPIEAIPLMLLPNIGNLLWLPPTVTLVKNVRNAIQLQMITVPGELLNIVMDYLIHS
jgi:hypothetical protein